jgi:Raf kinase inhibitor-like YbhB/YbcL family protein
MLWIAALAACGHHEDAGGAAGPAEPTAATTMSITSPAFTANAEIPSEHTCEGADVAPALAWSGAPAGTKSFAVVVDDPDAPDPAAPKRTWVHWVVVNIPAEVASLGPTLPAGAAAGANDWGKSAWGGPCPPIGRHRYFFKVYALDGIYGTAGMTKPALLAAISGHVLAKGELVGTYAKHVR